MAVHTPRIEGFFMKHHETVTKSLDAVTLNNFANLEDDERRVSFISTLSAVEDFDLKPYSKQERGKNLELAMKLKADGNTAVQKGDWLKALELYNESYINIPHDNVEEVSIIIANRSAALYHKGQVELSLADIQRCLAMGYPKHLKYKVYERKARCLLALKRNSEAQEAFRETIKTLDDSKLPLEKRQKMQTDAQLMLEILKKGEQLARQDKLSKKLADVELKANSMDNKTPPAPSLTRKQNKAFPSVSEAISFSKDDSQGRFAVASFDIMVGEVLVVESPHCAVLLEDFCKTHCQNCFTRCTLPIACPSCTNVIFCSEKCLEEANCYHMFECPILPTLWKSGCSITCHMALRTITQKTIDYFKLLKPQLKEPVGTYLANDYTTFYQLVAHEAQRNKQDLFHRAHMAAFLVKLLELSGYFPNRDQHSVITNGISESPERALIGGLLLRNLQVLQFNAHEVFDLQCDKPDVGDYVKKHLGKTVFVAGGCYPTLALFNHSCDPSVVRYFNGTTTVVRAVRNIKKGQQVYENYGPIFTNVQREERRQILKLQYWFDCHCVACEQNWSLYKDMNEKYMRFKCDSDRPCQNVVPVPHDCNEFMVPCGLCGQYTNILKGLKALQDTDMLFRFGKDAMEKGKYGEALAKYVEVLKLYDDTLVPPFRAYYDSIQQVRQCLLAMGNYSIRSN